MKKFITLTLALASIFSFHAQQDAPPQGINYQAVAIDNDGKEMVGVDLQGMPVREKEIRVRFSILKDTEDGLLTYREQHLVTTDAYGLFNTVIGQGFEDASPNTFEQIDWGTGFHFLKVEIDITGGTEYKDMGTQQLWSVPYALYSKYAAAAGNGIEAVTDNGDGTITFTYLDGSTYTTPTLTGLTGPQGDVGPQGPAGPSGQDGLSAYEIWLAEGNTGTEADFLAGITGPQGPQGVQGPAGTNGTNGLDGNGIASTIDNGDGTFTFTYDDGSTFTTSDLTGPQGATGSQGPQGIQGPAGVNGTNGLDGNGIASTTDNGDGTFTFTYDDGSTFTTSDLTGPQGAQGIQGPQGVQGIQGPAGANGTNGLDGNGITSTTDNGDGTITFTYDDGSTFTTSDLTGPQGVQGPQGIQGPAGANGANGLDGNGIASTTDNGDGTFTFTYDDGTTFTTSDLTGPQGAQGIQGPQGVQGPAGTNGTNGLDGNGIASTTDNGDGTFTFTYDDGSTFTTSDLTGPQGVQGPAGANGQDGLSAYQIWLAEGNTGTEADFIAGITGPQGPQGTQGPIGLTGAQGPQGIQGPAGVNGQDGLSAYQIWLAEGNTGTEADFIAGITGPQGIQGHAGANGQDGLSAYQIWLAEGNTGTEADFIAGITGPQGPQGAQGPAGVNGQDGLSAYQIWLAEGNTGTEADFIAGITGPQGPQGTQGPIGLTGATGPQGAQGPIGLTGAQGPQGVQGPAGVNGQDGLSAYQIWLAEGNTGTEADFIAGITGQQGPQGAQGPAGANGTNGLDGNGIASTTDNGDGTFTFTYDDGSTFTTSDLTGPAGTYTAGSGVIINNNEISIDANALPGNSQGMKIGFSSSTTWTCPPGVTQITVELWGGSGGAGSGQRFNPTTHPWPSGCYWVGSTKRAGRGGSGGRGGYIKQTVAVTPGTIYNITIGQGGTGGVIPSCSHWCNGNPGQDGGNSSFNGIVIAEGGKGGVRGQNCEQGAAGADGPVVSFDHPTTNYGSRTYIPSEYLTAFPSQLVNRSTGGQFTSLESATPTHGGFSTAGGNGENGYCVISY